MMLELGVGDCDKPLMSYSSSRRPKRFAKKGHDPTTTQIMGQDCPFRTRLFRTHRLHLDGSELIVQRLERSLFKIDVAQIVVP